MCPSATHCRHRHMQQPQRRVAWSITVHSRTAPRPPLQTQHGTQLWNGSLFNSCGLGHEVRVGTDGNLRGHHTHIPTDSRPTTTNTDPRKENIYV